MKKARNGFIKALPYLCLVGVIAFGLMTIVGTGGGGGGGGGGTQYDAQAIIGPEGGVVEVTDPDSPAYGAIIDIPSGALEKSTTITIATESSAPPFNEGMSKAGIVIDFGPDDTKFAKDILITIPYDDDDNDGYLDGTNILEEDISIVMYNPTFSLWLQKKIGSQDTLNNTVTVKTKHFTMVGSGAIMRAAPNTNKDVVFTIDGLKFNKILPILNNFEPREESYLKDALLNRIGININDFQVISYAGPPKASINVEKWASVMAILSMGCGFFQEYMAATVLLDYNKTNPEAWSGDPDQTDYLLEDLIETVHKEWDYAHNNGNKFIMVSHSWGTVLTELALSFNPDVKPDLVITLSAPRGSNKVDYNISHQFSEDEIIHTPDTKSELLQPFSDLLFDETIEEINALINSLSVDQVENICFNYSSGWIDHCITKMWEKEVPWNTPQFEKWINYYSTGDVISGPLKSVINNNIIDIPVEEGPDLPRDVKNTDQYHRILGLDWDGTSGINLNLLDLADDLRIKVKEDILAITECPELPFKDDFSDPTLAGWEQLMTGLTVIWQDCADGGEVTAELEYPTQGPWLGHSISPVDLIPIHFMAKVRLEQNLPDDQSDYVNIILGNEDYENFYYIQYGYYIDSAHIGIRLVKRSQMIHNPDVSEVLCATTLPFDTDYHNVSATRDASGNWSIQVDGEEVATANDIQYTQFGTISCSFNNKGGYITEVMVDETSLSEGLIAYFPFNENPYDESGNGHDGTEHGGVSYEDGKVGQAASFDGIDDYIYIWSREQINQYIDTTKGSISVWVKPDEQTNDAGGHIYHYLSDEQNNDRLYLCILSSDHITHPRHIQVGLSDSTPRSSNQLTFDGTWYHLVVVWEPDGTVKLYINGNLDTETSFGNPGFIFDEYQDYGHFYFGRDWGTRFYHGAIDELRIFSRALSEAEIEALANQ